ncbi:MAG: low temperature requirement protein A [Nakamurella sp.]
MTSPAAGERDPNDVDSFAPDGNRDASDIDSAQSSAGQAVSTLELFFDLVFVYTITQVTGVIDHDPGWLGAARGCLILALLFWMYGAFIWLTNASGVASIGRTIMVLAGMAALFVCSLAVPDAFGDGGIIFGAGYLALTLIHFIGYRRFGDPDGRRSILRMLPINAGGAGLILISGWTHGIWDWVLWTVTAAGYLTVLLVQPRMSGFRISAGHFAERHGLIIIIVLGESLASIGVAASGEHLNGSLLVGALCGFAASAAMWWAYFRADDTAAARQFEESQEHAVRLAGIGYNVSHLVMMIGIIGVAAGTRLRVGDLLGPSTGAASTLIAGGAAIYLLGTALFRVHLHYATAWPRVLGAAACLATLPLGRVAGAGQELALIAGVIVLATLADRLPRRAQPMSRLR